MYIPAIIMARGEGRRLWPLSAIQSKPSLPFGNGNRIIDFVLHNVTKCPNTEVYILSPKNASYLESHWQHCWSNQSILVPAHNKDIIGNAASVYQVLQLIPDSDHVIIGACDHVYRLSFSTFLQQHIEQQADISIAITTRSANQAQRYGVVQTKRNDITGFIEKPTASHPWLKNKTAVDINMGIYIFQRTTLKQLLEQDLNNPASNHDFGQDIIPLALNQHYRVQQYRLPNTNYWEDVGSMNSYWNIQWQYHQHIDQIPRTIMHSHNEITGCHLQTVSTSTHFTKCILHPNVTVGTHCRLSNLIIGTGSHIDDQVTLEPSTGEDFLVIPPYTHVTKQWLPSPLPSHNA